MKAILKRTGELVDVRPEIGFPDLYIDRLGGAFREYELEFIKDEPIEEKSYSDYFSYESTCTIPKECVDLQYVFETNV